MGRCGKRGRRIAKALEEKAKATKRVRAVVFIIVMFIRINCATRVKRGYFRLARN